MLEKFCIDPRVRKSSRRERLVRRVRIMGGRQTPVAFIARAHLPLLPLVAVIALVGWYLARRRSGRDGNATLVAAPYLDR